jgi:hypothetical protein
MSALAAPLKTTLVSKKEALTYLQVFLAFTFTLLSCLASVVREGQRVFDFGEEPQATKATVGRELEACDRCGCPLHTGIWSVILFMKVYLENDNLHLK